MRIFFCCWYMNVKVEVEVEDLFVVCVLKIGLYDGVVCLIV